MMAPLLRWDDRLHDASGLGEPCTRGRPRLPMWRQCVFVDWHGVLSDRHFWWSILDSGTHDLKRHLAPAVDDLFRRRVDLVTSWMRGSVSMEDVVSCLDVHLNRRYKADFLTRRLVEDCVAMDPRPALTSVLNEYRREQGVLVTVATDNMDCFAEAARRRSFGERFDGLLCSSDLGVLKAENPQRFFGAWLDEHGLEPADAILVDDSASNCRVFERWGGTAIHFRGEVSALDELWAWVESGSRR